MAGPRGPSGDLYGEVAKEHCEYGEAVMFYLAKAFNQCSSPLYQFSSGILIVPNVLDDFGSIMT